jgi:glyoxylase-like metal-dependent hydrolase (beta-lactamase superfamily II)
MNLHFFTFNPLQENTYIIWCQDTLECAIIDAGNYDSAEGAALEEFITANHLKPTLLLGTHAHIDHVFGNWFVKQKWDLPYYLNEGDIPMFARSEQMAVLWSLQYTPGPMPDHNLAHGDQIKIGNCEMEVRFVPGHAPGHVIFVNHTDRWIIGGDTLFRGSIGRTDLPGGNHDLLLKKIREEMFTLPDDYIVHSGHGPYTSIGFEKENNPFFLTTHWE